MKFGYIGARTGIRTDSCLCHSQVNHKLGYSPHTVSMRCPPRPRRHRDVVVPQTNKHGFCFGFRVLVCTPVVWLTVQLRTCSTTRPGPT